MREYDEIGLHSGSTRITPSNITIRYILALCLIGLLAIASYLVHSIIKTQETSAATINISGRQRMLSQKAALLSLRMSISDSDDEHHRWRKELIAVIDGFDLIKNIRANNRLKSVPIIVLTSSHDISTKERIIGLGANDFTMKSGKPEDIIPRIRRYIV